MRALIVALLLIAGGLAAAPGQASAAVTPAGCGLPGYVSGIRDTPCRAASAVAPSEESLLGSLPDPVTGLLRGAVSSALSEIVSWADRGAANALRLTSGLIGATTAPSLRSSWFSATYWRVAALSALLTLPFLFAAGIHALVRSDLGLLARAAFGYLPLAMLGVAIAAPIIALLLVGTDEMCSFVAAASSNADTDFFGRAATALSGASLLGADPFIVFFAALLTVAATISLWLELLIRGAAVEVIALMLPLFFSAMVWPARRIWAIRAIETLIALILSKFAIVAVLALGGAAITHAGSGPSALLTGATIVLLTVFTPWALLRLLPLHEVASAAAGSLSRPPRDAARWARDQAMAGGRRRGPRDGDSAESAPEEAGDDAAAPLRRLVERLDEPLRGLAAPAVAAETAFSPVSDAGLRAVGGSRANATEGTAAPVSTPAVAALGTGGGGSPGWRPSSEPVVLGEEGEDRMGSLSHLIEPVPGPGDAAAETDEPVTSRATGDAPAADPPAIDPPTVESPPLPLPPARGAGEPLTGTEPPTGAGDDAEAE